MEHRRLATVALVALVVLAGCSGAGGGGDAGEGVSMSDQVEQADAAADGETRADGAADTGGAGTDGTARADRAIIRTGEVRVEVESYDNATARLRTLAERYGGYVSASDRQVRGAGNETFVRGRLVVRVPSENFSALFRGSQGLGTVDSASTDTREVTDQLVDLNARIENLERQRDRLRELYQGANETEAVLEVSRELSSVQGEIERLEAERRTLRERVAMSTLRVEIHEPRPEPVVRNVPFHETGLVSAFLASIDGVVVAVRTTAVAFAYALPYLLVFGVPVGGLAAVLYRRRRGGPDGDVATVAPPPSPGDDGELDDDGDDGHERE
jgi:cell division protein FtsB